MSVECGYCGNKIHDENCPKYPYCQGCKKGRGRSDHEAECIYAYTLPKQRASRSKEWFKNKIDLEQGETVSAGSLSELDVEEIKENILKLSNTTAFHWGHEKLILSDDLCEVRRIFIKANGHCPLLNKINSSLFLLSGKGYINMGKAGMFMMNKTATFIHGNLEETFSAIEDSVVLEVRVK